MEMGKLLLLLAFVCLTSLTIGTALFPQSAAFWLASGGIGYTLVRTALGAVLLVQFFTDPPRHVYFRILAGLLATAVGGWALSATFSNEMELLDSLSLLASAAAIGCAALEMQVTPKKSQNRVRTSKRAATA